ncbi:MAG: hypothetical protein AAF909_00515 [Pseudomonadota bacterium]
MPKLRYSLLSDWPFYTLLASYAYLVGSMTVALWFGGGVNIFASYTDTIDGPAFVLDANKVYWAKTIFLFSSIALFGFNFDYRAAAGLGAVIWATALILMYGATPVLAVALINGLVLVALQIWRGALFGGSQGHARAGARAGATS